MVQASAEGRRAAAEEHSDSDFPAYLCTSSHWIELNWISIQNKSEPQGSEMMQHFHQNSHMATID